MGIARRRLHRPGAGLALALAACSGGEPVAPEQQDRGIVETRDLVAGGRTRSYTLYVPAGVGTGNGLILAFHGAASSGVAFRATTDLDRVAEGTRSAIAFPNADHFNWAEDCRCIEADELKLVADTALVSGLIDTLVPEFGLARGKVYAVGFSQGGLFVQRLACQMSGRFAGVAVVGSTMSLQLSERCTPTARVGFLLLISQQDDAYPWEGRIADPFTTLGAPATHALWNDRNRCGPQPADQDPGPDVRLRSTGCEGGTRTELLGVDRGIHSWFISQNVDVGAELIRHFGG